MTRARNETEILSLTKKCETPIEQTQTKPQEILEFKLIKLSEIFHFNTPSSIEGSWMIGFLSLEIYKSIFNMTEHTNKFELFTETFDKFSVEELKCELEQILIISDITPQELQHEILGPRIIQTYKILRSKKSSTDGFFILFLRYARSLLRENESYLRNIVDLDENDIQLILKQYNPNFVTYEIPSGIYSINGISLPLYTKGNHDGTIQIGYDDITMKTKPI